MIRLVLPGQPIGAPRMTRADAWKRRPCVLAYRAWRDAARAATLAAGHPIPVLPLWGGVRIMAFFAPPPSWSARKTASLRGEPHRSKPDWDNVAKAVCDLLWEGCDQVVWAASVTKRWDDGEGPRVVVEIEAA